MVHDAFFAYSKTAREWMIDNAVMSQRDKMQISREMDRRLYGGSKNPQGGKDQFTEQDRLVNAIRQIAMELNRAG